MVSRVVLLMHASGMSWNLVIPDALARVCKGGVWKNHYYLTRCSYCEDGFLLVVYILFTLKCPH